MKVIVLVLRRVIKIATVWSSKKYVLFPSEKRKTSEEIVSAMKELGLRPATKSELFWWKVRYWNGNNNFFVVALCEPIFTKLMRKKYPVICPTDSPLEKLHLFYDNEDWSRYMCLAVHL